MLVFVSLSIADFNDHHIYFNVIESNEKFYCLFPRDAVISSPHTMIANVGNKKVTVLEASSRHTVKYLPVNTADVFPNLEEIDITLSGVKSLTYANFRGLFKLTKLHFSLNILDIIEKNSFKDLTSLKVLYLPHNHIEILSKHLFVNLESLEKLFLFGNQIFHLNPEQFKNNRNLIQLDLSNNKLQSIEFGIFDSLRNLLELYLHRNEVMRLPGNIFQNNKQLRWLSLSRNLFSRIDGNSLTGLENLVDFELTDNPLESFDFAVFENKQNLETIYISNCKIKFIRNIQEAAKLEKLRFVDLSKNICIDRKYSTSGLRLVMKEEIETNCGKNKSFVVVKKI